MYPTDQEIKTIIAKIHEHSQNNTEISLSEEIAGTTFIASKFTWILLDLVMKMRTLSELDKQTNDCTIKIIELSTLIRGLMQSVPPELLSTPLKKIETTDEIGITPLFIVLNQILTAPRDLLPCDTALLAYINSTMNQIMLDAWYQSLSNYPNKHPFSEMSVTFGLCEYLPIHPSNPELREILRRISHKISTKTLTNDCVEGEHTGHTPLSSLVLAFSASPEDPYWLEVLGIIIQNISPEGLSLEVEQSNGETAFLGLMRVAEGLPVQSQSKDIIINAVNKALPEAFVTVVQSGINKGLTPIHVLVAGLIKNPANRFLLELLKIAVKKIPPLFLERPSQIKTEQGHTPLGGFASLLLNHSDDTQIVSLIASVIDNASAEGLGFIFESESSGFGNTVFRMLSTALYANPKNEAVINILTTAVQKCPLATIGLPLHRDNSTETPLAFLLCALNKEPKNKLLQNLVMNAIQKTLPNVWSMLGGDATGKYATLLVTLLDIVAKNLRLDFVFIDILSLAIEQSTEEAFTEDFVKKLNIAIANTHASSIKNSMEKRWVSVTVQMLLKIMLTTACEENVNKVFTTINHTVLCLTYLLNDAVTEGCSIQADIKFRLLNILTKSMPLTKWDEQVDRSIVSKKSSTNTPLSVDSMLFVWIETLENAFVQKQVKVSQEIMSIFTHLINQCKTKKGVDTSIWDYDLQQTKPSPIYELIRLTLAHVSNSAWITLVSELIAKVPTSALKDTNKYRFSSLWPDVISSGHKKIKDVFDKHVPKLKPTLSKVAKPKVSAKTTALPIAEYKESALPASSTSQPECLASAIISTSDVRRCETKTEAECLMAASVPITGMSTSELATLLINIGHDANAERLIQTVLNEYNRISPSSWTEICPSIFKLTPEITPLLSLISLLRQEELCANTSLYQLVSRVIPDVTPKAWGSVIYIPQHENHWTPLMLLMDILFWRNQINDQLLAIVRTILIACPQSVWLCSLKYKNQDIEHPLRLFMGIIEYYPTNNILVETLNTLINNDRLPTEAWRRSGVGPLEKGQTAEIIARRISDNNTENPILNEAIRRVEARLLAAGAVSSALQRMFKPTDDTPSYLKRTRSCHA